WSKARLKNVEYIATTGRRPPMAMPAAEVTAVCSAIPTSKNRSGHRPANGNKPVGPGMAAPPPTTAGQGRRHGHHRRVALPDVEHGLVERLRMPLGSRPPLGRPDRGVEDRGVVQ